MTLTEYLEAKSMTRQDFAGLVGVDPITVYRWENGSRLPVKHFAKIAEVTNNSVTANDFVQRGSAA